MRIVILTTSLAGGGAEFVARTWATWLAQNGQDVRVLTTSATEDRVLEGGARVKALACRGHFRLARRLRAELSGEAADVVLALQSYPNVVAIAALSGRRGAPALIVSERNITSRENEPTALGERLKMWIARRSYRCADLAIAVSHPVAAELVSAFGMRDGQVVVVPNPSGHSAEQRTRPRTTDTIPVDSAAGPLHLVLPLRLVPQKRAELAVAAAALLREQGTDARLVCFGKGPERAQLEETARAAGVPLTVPGWSADWTQDAPPGSVVVLPSYREGFGNVLVEAAMAGIPSVAVSNSYGVADALIPTMTGEMAFTGTPEAVAAAVLRARGLSMRHVTEWAHRFSTDESGRQLMASLKKAIARRNAT